MHTYSYLALAMSALILTKSRRRSATRECRRNRKRAIAQLKPDADIVYMTTDNPEQRQAAADWLYLGCKLCGRCEKPLRAPRRTPA